MAVVLKKGQKVSLEKKGPGTLGEISVNLNWNQTPQKKGFFASLTNRGGVDLDLGCLFEMKNGRKAAVQALGNAFGSLNAHPFIALDGDDRTGESAAGETMRINGAKISEFRRILIYTFIYEGVANWKQVDGVVTLRCPGSEDIVVHMDEYQSSQSMCAIAMLENQNDETFSVEKLVRFFDGHSEMDRAYSWGIRWTPGRK